MAAAALWERVGLSSDRVTEQQHGIWLARGEESRGLDLHVLKVSRGMKQSWTLDKHTCTHKDNVGVGGQTGGQHQWFWSISQGLAETFWQVSTEGAMRYICFFEKGFLGSLVSKEKHQEDLMCKFLCQSAKITLYTKQLQSKYFLCTSWGQYIYFILF